MNMNMQEKYYQSYIVSKEYICLKNNSLWSTNVWELQVPYIYVHIRKCFYIYTRIKLYNYIFYLEICCDWTTFTDASFEILPRGFIQEVVCSRRRQRRQVINQVFRWFELYFYVVRCELHFWVRCEWCGVSKHWPEV